MPLKPVLDLVHDARDKKYALGYFESWNFESLQGVLDAAEQTRSPIIIGFNGDFMSHGRRRVPERLRCYAELGKAAAAGASVPCGLIFNECPRDEWVREAMLAGFNLVMPADPEATYEDIIRRVTALTEQAHQRGVAVEAEIGQLPSGASGEIKDDGQMTDPEVAACFVRATGVDLLAVSVGNVHVMLRGERELDLDRLARIHEQVSIPLVLHGGTGIPGMALREAIRRGVAKVNYGTYLKKRYLKAVSFALEKGNTNPHELLGLGGDWDVMVAGRIAVRDAVLERIELLGCCGRAKI
jgi:ketose-bisphosphate aldolase